MIAKSKYKTPSTFYTEGNVDMFMGSFFVNMVFRDLTVWWAEEEKGINELNQGNLSSCQAARKAGV